GELELALPAARAAQLDRIRLACRRDEERAALAVLQLDRLLAVDGRLAALADLPARLQHLREKGVELRERGEAAEVLGGRRRLQPLAGEQRAGGPGADALVEGGTAADVHRPAHAHDVDLRAVQRQRAAAGGGGEREIDADRLAAVVDRAADPHAAGVVRGLFRVGEDLRRALRGLAVRARSAAAAGERCGRDCEEEQRLPALHGGRTLPSPSWRHVASTTSASPSWISTRPCGRTSACSAAGSSTGRGSWSRGSRRRPSGSARAGSSCSPRSGTTRPSAASSRSAARACTMSPTRWRTSPPRSRSSGPAVRSSSTRRRGAA